VILCDFPVRYVSLLEGSVRTPTATDTTGVVKNDPASTEMQQPLGSWALGGQRFSGLTPLQGVGAPFSKKRWPWDY